MTHLTTLSDIKRLKELAGKATPGPYFLADDLAEGTPHAHSGLALIDTGRAEDWTVASLMEWNTAAYLHALLEAAPALLAAYEDAERLRYLLNLNEEERAFVEATSVHIATLDENGEFNIVQGDEALAAIDAVMGDKP